MNKPTLSILILISNRPDTVKKCLDSVMPILEKVPSELILTDTGCGETVRRIIENYDATILDFEWCKDFAKARNVGLNASSGEWFLYIDDDEWFENTDEIIDFFTSGEYKKYGYASYIIRNYYDWEGKSYSDFCATRVFKRTENMQFIYSIHEFPRGVNGDRKIFESYVHHYGYIYKSIDDKKAHDKRNIELLKKEYEKNPLDVRIAMHYADGLRAEDSVTTCRICKKIVEEYKGGSEEGKAYCLVPTMVEALFLLGQYDEALSYAEWALSLKANLLFRAHVFGVLALLYLKECNYEETLKNAKEYLILYENRYVDDYRKYQSPLQCEVFEKKKYSMIIQAGIIAALKLEDSTKLTEWFDSLSSDDFNDRRIIYDVELIDQLAISYLSSNKDIISSVIHIYEALDANKKMYNTVAKSIFQACDCPEKLEKFADITGNNVALILSRIIKGINSNRDIYIELEEFMYLWKSIDLVYQQINKYALDEYIQDRISDIKKYTKNLKFSEWTAGTYTLIKKCDVNSLTKVERFLTEIADNDAEKIVIIEYACSKKRLNDKATYNNMFLFEKIDIIDAYTIAIDKRVRNIYSSQMIDNYEYYLSEEDIFGIKYRLISGYIKDEEFESAIQIAKEMINEDSEFLTYIKDIINWINEASIESTFSVEMLELAHQIKNKIRQLNSVGETEAALEAYKVLQSYY